MSLSPGTHHLGPADATLAVHTTRTGAAAKAGHNLVIEVDAWDATIEVGEQTTIALTADAGSLRVIEGHGGMQSLGDDDKANIKGTIDDEILKGTQIAFSSTTVEASDDATLHVEGELTLMGASQPLSFDLQVGDDGSLEASAVVTQTRWGMKPYSTLFGTLKVGDDVTVTLNGRPSS
jgi:polyisoprenoid-binding protein YceI